MHESEYRFFITRIRELETEAEGLKRTLRFERASFDEVADAAKEVEKAYLEERESARKVIAELEAKNRRHERKRYIPGIIGGAGAGTGGGVQGLIGVGWKIDIW
jgi:hypothetical protein